MPLRSLVRRLLGKRLSKEHAKDRLLTILVSDRLGLSSDQMQALRTDILAAINRHLSVDTQNARIDFVQHQTPGEVVINAPVRPKPSTDKPPRSSANEGTQSD